MGIYFPTFTIKINHPWSVSSMEFFSHLHTSRPPRDPGLIEKWSRLMYLRRGGGSVEIISIPFGRSTPWKINGWKLQITHLERKMIFQTSVIIFDINLQGCALTETNELHLKMDGISKFEISFPRYVYFQVLRCYVSFRKFLNGEGIGVTDQQLNSWDAYSDRKKRPKITKVSESESMQQNRSHVVGIYISSQWCFGSCFWVRKKRHDFIHGNLVVYLRWLLLGIRCERDAWGQKQAINH